MLDGVLKSVVNTEENNKDKIGYIYSFLSSIFFVFANLFVKLLNMSPAELAYYRSLSFVVLGYHSMSAFNLRFHFPTKKINRMLLIRGCIGIVALVFTYYGVKLLPLSEWVVVHQTTPVITAGLAPFILHERFEWISIFTILLSMVGITFIAKPPFLFGGEEGNQDTYNHILGVLFSLTGAFLNSFTQLLIKKLGGKTNTVVIVYYFGVIGMIYGAVVSLYQGFIMPKGGDFIALFLIGFLSFLGQILKNRSYMYGKAARISMMGYSQILINYFIDIFYFGIKPDAYSLFGSFLIISCILALISKEA